MAEDKQKMGLIQATSIAVGTMIGASIFSIFGLGARIAGHNLRGAAGVGRIEFMIVLVKLGILAVFVVLGLGSVKLQWVVPTLEAGHSAGILYATAVFFLSYMGFGLVTNAAEDIHDAARNVPRAIYLSIAVVTLVYVLVSAVAVGNLPLAELIKAQDFALAEAARPFLGKLGYLFVSIGALFSIASAINATLYGGANVAYTLAKDGELPELFERKAWFHAPEGLYITAGLSMLFALLFDLNGIASITSAVIMVIYLFVLLSHYRLAPSLGGNRPFILFATVVVGVVFLVLQSYLWQNNRFAFWTTWLAFAASLLLEFIYRAVSRRRFVIQEIETLEKGFVGIFGNLINRLRQSFRR